MNGLSKAGFWMLDYAYSGRAEVRAAIDRRGPGEYFESFGAGADARPVVLVPGVFNTWHTLRPVGAEAARLGHPVHVVTALGRNTASVESAARVVAAYLEEHELQNVVLLAHSKGGLIGKYLMWRFDRAERIDGLIAVNSPFSGSQWGRLVPLPSVRALAPTDPTMRFVGSASEVDARIVSVYSTFDQNVWAGSRLPGATNVQLDVAGHSRILASRAMRKFLPEAFSLLPRRPDSPRTASVPPEPSPH